MKRSSRLLLGGLIVAKAGLVVLLLCGRGDQVFFFQTQAMASGQTQAKGRPAQTEPGKVEPESADLEAALRVKVEIEKEKESIRRERQDLLVIQEDITKKLQELSRLRDEIRAQMETKKSVEEQRMKHLVKVYSGMKPQIAAGLIERLDLSFAVEILSRMQGDTVGGILSFVDKEKAAKICQGLVKPR